jgi:hypothetical protein
MTDAYRYAAGGGHKPHELQLYDFIQRFGYQAVAGSRVLSAREVYRMNAAVNIRDAKQSKMTSDNWAQWAKENKLASELLVDVEKMLQDDE